MNVIINFAEKVFAYQRHTQALVNVTLHNLSF